MKIISTNFNSHKVHNPDCDILEGQLNDDAFITYGIFVNGPKKGKEFMEYYKGSNYNLTSKAKSFSRLFDDVTKIPIKYKQLWSELKQIYEEKYRESSLKENKKSMKKSELKHIIKEIVKENKIKMLVKESFLTGESDKLFDELFSKLIPPSGPSKYFEGEILRALNKIIYRYYNDGDYCFDGYGIETAGAPAMFLKQYANRIPNLQPLISELISGNKRSYKDILNKMSDVILPYIKEKVDSNSLTQNSDDMLRDEYQESAFNRFKKGYMDEQTTKLKKIIKEMITELNSDIMRQMGFGKEMDNVQKGFCPICGKKIDPKTEFKDDLSRREFKISGLCQKCQDSTFNEKELDEYAIKPKRKTIKEAYDDFGSNGVDSRRMMEIGIKSQDIQKVNQIADEVKKRVGDIGSCVLGEYLIARIQIPYGKKFIDAKIIRNYSQGNLGPEEIYQKAIDYLAPKYPNIHFYIEWGRMD